MNRRALLAAAGSTAVAPFAGCLSDAAFLGESDPVEFSKPPSEYPINTGPTGDGGWTPHDTFVEFEIGSRDDNDYRPHYARVWNAAGVSELEFSIYDALSESVVHHDSYELPENEEVKATLFEPSKYLLKVRIPATDTKHIARVPCNFFDCNRHSTRIKIIEPETIESTVGGTLLLCADRFEC